MSKLTDFFNRIFNNQKKLPSSNEAFLEQYDYNELMNYMYNTGSIEEYYVQKDLINLNSNKYYPSKVHGIEHTSRVTLLATILTTLDEIDPHTKNLILTSARLHDIGRIDDRETKEHGLFGSNKISNDNLLAGFSKNDQELIKFVVEQHSLSREENQKAIDALPFRKRKQYTTVLNYLKDADALDRVRIANKNAQLDPRRLRTETAQKLVNFSYENFRNFNQVENKYFENRLNNKELSTYYDLIKDSVSDPSWVISNIQYLRRLYNNGVLQNCYNSKFPFINIFNENLTNAVDEININDFKYLRDNNYNITYETFLRVVDKYKPGTLKILREQGKLKDLFSKEAFEKYGKEETLREQISKYGITDQEMLDELNTNATTTLTKQTFNNNYLLYRDLYENNSEGYDALVMSNNEIPIMSVSGILNKFNIIDINKLIDSGYNLSFSDFINISSHYTPEEYIQIMQSASPEKLVAYNGKTINDKKEYNNNFAILRGMNPNITEDEFYKNYYLYKEICRNKINIYSVKGMEQYSIQDIYPAYSRMIEADERLKWIKNMEGFSFGAENLLDLIQFSERTALLNSQDENEKDDIIKFLVENNKYKNDSRFIEYVAKKNKVYQIENINENAADISNYNQYCIDRILSDDSILLSVAKKNLINSLFSINTSNSSYQDELETNIVDEFYYYLKYDKENQFNAEQNDSENEFRMAIQSIIKIFDKDTISEFKNSLYEARNTISQYNFDSILGIVRERMTELAKKDFVKEQQTTRDDLNNSPTYKIQYKGQNIPVKILSGKKFTISATTVMPYCSGVVKSKFNSQEDKIKENMINRPLNPDNRCCYTITEKMIAHPKSALQDCELGYVYVADNERNISSVMGVHDLSTRKKNVNGVIKRKTAKAIQNRKARDIVAGTTEEHNETVMNGVYPRYIVAFDGISEMALEKYLMLKKQYEETGINQPLEILLIEAQKSYLPQIENELYQNFYNINLEMQKTKSISRKTLDRFFNKRERNITLQTIQAINSKSYRDDVWDPNKNSQMLGQLTDILEKVSVLAPREYIGQVKSQIEFLLDKSSGMYYDHSYVESINTYKLSNLKQYLDRRLEENGGQTNVRNSMEYNKEY